MTGERTAAELAADARAAMLEFAQATRPAVERQQRAFLALASAIRGTATVFAAVTARHR